MLVVVLSYPEHNYHHFLVHTTTPPLYPIQGGGPGGLIVPPR